MVIHQTLGKKADADAPQADLQVYLLPEKGHIETITLSAKATGIYSMAVGSVAIDFESDGTHWNAKCKNGCGFLPENGDGSSLVYSAVLHEHTILTAINGNDSACMYVEEIKPENMLFHNYQYLCNEFTIGRRADRDIICDASYSFISRDHASFKLSGGQWYVIDNGSANGVYVNDERVASSPLKLGDVVFIMGIRIIFGLGFISVNNGSGSLRFHPDKFLRISSTDDLNLFQPLAGTSADEPFNRLPRRRQAFETEEIVIDAPPLSMNGNKLPLVLRMGSSAIMGGSAALRGNYVTLLTSLVMPLLSQKYNDKTLQEYEERRTEKYTEYLEKKKEEIDAEKAREERILRENYPPLSTILRYTEDRKQLWERRKTDDDFLSLRLGKGQRPLQASVNCPEKEFDLESDALEDAMHELGKRKVRLEDVPIMLDLVNNYVCGITGRSDICQSLALQVLLDLVVLHSSDEVKTVFLLRQEELDRLDFIKFLPHAWNDQRDIRFIATDAGEALQLGEFFKRELEIDSTHGTPDLKSILKTRPYYVFFAFSKPLFDSIEVLKDIMQEDKNCGVSVITLYDEMPKECSALISAGERGVHTVSYLRELDRPDEEFIADDYAADAMKSSMRKLANLLSNASADSYELPKALTFLDMFNVGRVEHLDPLKRWKESNPTKTLATPVGVDTSGSTFNLDLHQKYQGPHGLVAGMTGSGKSEFLITYILSLALNYSPDDVSFLLIDYKGGGLAGAFDDPGRGIHLPHLVGTITNLDGSAIQRSLISIDSELKRRQRVFREAASAAGEGTMDIYTYQKLFRAGKVSEPVPHLFIISDEFAELKAQQPDFMEALISTARIGRSLGVHLILATQRPTGVVNEQIRSNTKFRVCLKVQDKGDSQDMLGRPEAAELKETGRFYLQVGYNEFFALGQSGWSGADYEPQDVVTIKRDDSVQLLDATGQVQGEAKPMPKKGKAKNSQLVEIVNMLSTLAVENKILPRSLWKPALASALPIDSPLLSGEEERNSLTIPLGLIDDPENQTQFPHVIDFTTSDSMLVVGDGGSGKTALLQSVVYQLAEKNTPEDFNFYILDYSSRLFKMFKSLPHCGGVLYEEDSDTLVDFFKLIKGIITERKKLFTELEVDNFEAARKLRRLPLVLVVIDNATGMSSTKKGDGIFRDLHSYVKGAASYGVKFLLSFSRINDASSQLRLASEERIAFHMKDKYEYSDVVNCKVTYEPPDKPGRGLVGVGGRPLEFHAAMYLPGEDEQKRVNTLKDALEQIAERNADFGPAEHLPVLDQKATYEDFSSQFKYGRIPLGFSAANSKPVALPLKQFSELSLYFGNAQGVVPVTENFLFAAKREHMQLWIVRRMKDSIFSEGSPKSVAPELYENARFFNSTPEDMLALWQALSAEITSRDALLNKYCEENEIDLTDTALLSKTFPYMHENTEPIMVLIENMADTCVASDMVALLMLDKLLSVGQKRNIFSIACFEPDDAKRAEGKFLYSSYNQDNNILLLGGNCKQQNLCILPTSSDQFDGILPYNVGIMAYHGGFHPILVPCGEVKVEKQDDDELDIF